MEAREAVWVWPSDCATSLQLLHFHRRPSRLTDLQQQSVFRPVWLQVIIKLWGQGTFKKKSGSGQ